MTSIFSVMIWVARRFSRAIRTEPTHHASPPYSATIMIPTTAIATITSTRVEPNVAGMLKGVLKTKERKREFQRQPRRGADQTECTRADRRHNPAARLGKPGPDGDTTELQTAEALDDGTLEYRLRDFLRLIDEQPRNQQSRHDDQHRAQQCDKERRQRRRHPTPRQPVVHRCEQDGEDRNTNDPCRS